MNPRQWEPLPTANVAFDEFQSIYLEPEKEDEKKRGASTLLALGENVGQAV